MVHVAVLQLSQVSAQLVLGVPKVASPAPNMVKNRWFWTMIHLWLAVSGCYFSSISYFASKFAMSTYDDHFMITTRFKWVMGNHDCNHEFTMIHHFWPFLIAGESPSPASPPWLASALLDQLRVPRSAASSRQKLPVLRRGLTMCTRRRWWSGDTGPGWVHDEVMAMFTAVTIREFPRKFDERLASSSLAHGWRLKIKKIC